MKNITTGIFSKFTALVGGAYNDFYTSISGRLYDSQAIQDALYPYAVYQVISNVNPRLTFVEKMQESLIQFTLVSNVSSSLEVKNMLAYCKTLYNGATFTVVSNTLVYMVWENEDLMKDDDGEWVATSAFRLLVVES